MLAAPTEEDTDMPKGSPKNRRAAALQRAMSEILLEVQESGDGDPAEVLKRIEGKAQAALLTAHRNYPQETEVRDWVSVYEQQALEELANAEAAMNPTTGRMPTDDERFLVGYSLNRASVFAGLAALHKAP